VRGPSTALSDADFEPVATLPPRPTGRKPAAAHETIDRDGHRETWPIRSMQFRFAYMRYLRRQLDRSIDANSVLASAICLKKSAINAAIEDFESRAICEPTVRDVSVRVAGHDGDIYIDLGTPSWEAVRVTTNWKRDDFIVVVICVMRHETHLNWPGSPFRRWPGCLLRSRRAPKSGAKRAVQFRERSRLDFGWPVYLPVGLWRWHCWCETPARATERKTKYRRRDLSTRINWGTRIYLRRKRASVIVCAGISRPAKVERTLAGLSAPRVAFLEGAQFQLFSVYFRRGRKRRGQGPAA
jgi:hypothetical protein